jgi:hypothetical protein
MLVFTDFPSKWGALVAEKYVGSLQISEKVSCSCRRICGLLKNFMGSFQISEKVKPPPLVTTILTKLSGLIPTWKIVPSANIIDNAFKDPIKREEVPSRSQSCNIFQEFSSFRVRRWC